MANEIQYLHDDAAEAVYCILRNPAGLFYDANADDDFEAFAVADWSDYAIDLAQADAAGSGNVAMRGDMPAEVPAGYYRLDFFVRAGASPAQTDVRLGGTFARWDGATLSDADAWVCSLLRAALAVLAGNMSFSESTGEAIFLDAEDGSTQRASYKVSATSVGRSEASLS